MRGIHEEVAERTPAKDAPADEWVAFYRWSADTYEQHNCEHHAEAARYRAKLYEQSQP